MSHGLATLLLLAALTSGCGRTKSGGSDAAPDSPADLGTAEAAPPEAGPDAVDGACAPDAEISCGSVVSRTDVVICSDYFVRGLCVQGAWTCPEGLVESAACDCAEWPAAGCTRCSKQGWVCDAGSD